MGGGRVTFRTWGLRCSGSLRVRVSNDFIIKLRLFTNHPLSKKHKRENTINTPKTSCPGRAGGSLDREPALSLY